MHWDGDSWQVIRMTNVKGSENLIVMDAATTDDIWVVGDRFVPETPFPFAARWNGSSWSEVPVEDANELGVFEAVASD